MTCPVTLHLQQSMAIMHIACNQTIISGVFASREAARETRDSSGLLLNASD
jgi:hypothetical protein